MGKYKYLALIFVLFFIPYYGLFQNFKNTPPDRYYFGSVDNAIDVLGNFDTVRQGFAGRWTRSPNKTTAVSGKSTFLKFEYILIGHIARVIHTDPIVTYYVIRAILSIAAIGIILRMANFSLLPLLFIFFATGITEPWNTWPMRIMDSMPGDTLVFQRLTTAAPHYLLGIILPLLSMYFLSRSRFVIATVFGFVGTFVYTPSMILVIGSLWLLFFYKKQSRGALILYSIISLLPIVYIRYVSQFWDLNLFVKTENIVPFRLNIFQYFFAVGSIFIFSLFSIPEILKKKNPLHLLFLPWIIVHPLGALILSNILSVNASRFFFGPYFVVFGILAYMGIRRFKPLIILLFAILALGSSFISYGASINYTRVCFCNVQFSDYGYPKKDLMDAIFWLRDNTTESDGVLSGPYAGAIIPAFSNNRVYTSFWLRIMDESLFTKLDAMSKQFYEGSMNENEARAFLRNYNMAYVLVGEQESGKGLTYPDLSLTASFGSVRLYKFINTD